MVVREFHAVLPSTQREAIRLARAGAPIGSRVVAGRQSAGRGRLDHRWFSPKGGLYLSIILGPPAEGTSVLPLAVGAQVARALHDRLGIQPALKWPNDLLIVGHGPARKLGGILLDQVESPVVGRRAVAGIGLNVAAIGTALPPELATRSVSLSELVEPSPALRDVEEWVAGAAVAAADDLGRPGGHDRALELVRAHLHGVGCRATVDGTLSGVISAVGDEGELWLRTPEGPVAVRSGDLVVEEA